jgi:hypothetical protein
MKTPHKHAEVIKAWADGASIQCKITDYSNDWFDCELPTFSLTRLYRVKPETIKYRVALLEDGRGTLSTATWDERDLGRVNENSRFVKWLTDWVEVEV